MNEYNGVCPYTQKPCIHYLEIGEECIDDCEIYLIHNRGGFQIIFTETEKELPTRKELEKLLSNY